MLRIEHFQEGRAGISVEIALTNLVDFVSVRQNKFQRGKSPMKSMKYHAQEQDRIWSSGLPESLND